MGKHVVIGPKSEPILNDVTADELRDLTDHEIVPTGGVVGVSLEDIKPDARRLLFDPEWLIISKGMGNFETISEFEDLLKGRLVYILRAKCEPVARANNVNRGSLCGSGLPVDHLLVHRLLHFCDRRSFLLFLLDLQILDVYLDLEQVLKRH